MPRTSISLVVAAVLLAACASDGPKPPGPTHPVEAVGKVIDSLAVETAKRMSTDAFRGLPVVVVPGSPAGNTVELIVAEFLRTRLLERGLVVHKACGEHCLEIAL